MLIQRVKCSCGLMIDIYSSDILYKPGELSHFQVLSGETCAG